MTALDDRYPLEIVERCLKWTQQDEGKIFWRWIKQEIDAEAGAERYLGAWEIEDIIKANVSLAREDATKFVAEFPDKLKNLISEKKRRGKDLTGLDEIQ